MKLLLQIILIIFFLAMIVFLFLGIMQCIYYIKYQKTDKLHISLRVFVIKKNMHMWELYYENKKIDEVMKFSKVDREYLFLGIGGIYKTDRGKVIAMSRENVTNYDISLMNEMHEEILKNYNTYDQDITKFKIFWENTWMNTINKH